MLCNTVSCIQFMFCFFSSFQCSKNSDIIGTVFFSFLSRVHSYGDYEVV